MGGSQGGHKRRVGIEYLGGHWCFTTDYFIATGHDGYPGTGLDRQLDESLRGGSRDQGRIHRLTCPGQGRTRSHVTASPADEGTDFHCWKTDVFTSCNELWRVRVFDRHDSHDIFRDLCPGHHGDGRVMAVAVDTVVVNLRRIGARGNIRANPEPATSDVGVADAVPIHLGVVESWRGARGHHIRSKTPSHALGQWSAHRWQLADRLGQQLGEYLGIARR